MTPITLALNAGHSASQILNYLRNSNPSLAQGINAMIAANYTSESILRYLNKSGVVKTPKNFNVFADAHSGIDKPTQTALKVGGGLAAAGLGALGLRGISSAATGLGNMGMPQIGTSAQTQPLQIGNLPTQQPSPMQGGVIGQPLPAPAGNVPIAQPEPTQVSALQSISQIPWFENFKTLSQNNPPEVVAQGLKSMISPKEIAQFEMQQGKPWDQIIGEAYQELKTVSPPAPSPIEEIQPVDKEILSPNSDISQPKDLFPEQTAKEIEPVKTESSNLVITPSGKIAEIQSENKGLSKVLVDGESKSFKTDKLEKPEQSMLQAVNDLLKIPPEDRSGPIALTTYSKPRNQLIVQFHNGRIVEYDGVTPEEFAKISFEGSTAKTTGENEYGAWHTGKENSRGAALSNFIKQEKYSKDNKEKTWRYLDDGYDYWKSLRSTPKSKKIKVEIKEKDAEKSKKRRKAKTN